MGNASTQVGRVAYADDLERTLARAADAGVTHQILTAGSLSETHETWELAQTYPRMYSTAGCHPTRSTGMSEYQGGVPAYIAALRAVIDADRRDHKRIVAVGECGLGTSANLTRLRPAALCACRRTKAGV